MSGRTKLLDAPALDYAVREVRKGLAAAESDEQATALEKKRSRLQSEIGRLTEAIANSGGSEALLGALRKKESELKAVERTISSLAAVSIPMDLKRLREQIERSVETLPAHLQLDPERARMHLRRHITEIRMYPTSEGGKKFYVAEGEWFMPDNNNATGAWIDGGASMLRMVAGDRNAPNAHCIFIRLQAVFPPSRRMDEIVVHKLRSDKKEK